MNFLFLGSFVGLMVIGVPIAIAMALGSLAYIWATGTVPPGTLIYRMIGGVDSFPLLAVPFFILAGNLMNSAGVTTRIFDFAMDLVCWLRGGMGHVTIVSAVIFSGMSGTAIADASGLGTITVKAMTERGYPLPFTVGVISASSTMGPIIPPSLAMVIYGVQSNASIGRLFTAGFVPGALMAILMMAFVTWIACRRNFGKDGAFRWPAFTRSALELLAVAATGMAMYHIWGMAALPSGLRFFAPFVGALVVDRLCGFRAYLALLTPAILIGGMASGLFTPTEAAVAAVFWSMLLGFVVYRTLSWRMFVKQSFESMETTASIMFIVAAASVFGWVLTTTRLTEGIGDWVLSASSSPLVFLVLVNGFLLVVGCFMETIAAITILTPVLMPIVLKLHIDPVQFGVIMVLNLMIGLLTPPVGLIIFVMARISQMSFDDVVRAVTPWLAPLMAALVLITVSPEITLFLPRLVYDG
jgi:TRAP-type C4-dicarboxylate transport system permease large subunit